MYLYKMIIKINIILISICLFYFYFFFYVIIKLKLYNLYNKYIYIFLSFHTNNCHKSSSYF